MVSEEIGCLFEWLMLDLKRLTEVSFYNNYMRQW